MTVTASEALRKLEVGNERFRGVSSQPGVVALEEHRGFSDLSVRQEPFAAVLACSDSRVPVETIFRQGPGRLFVVRVAGNVVGEPQLGSLEFAAEVLGVPLVLVMGHTGCGAVEKTLEMAAQAEPQPVSRNLEAIIGPISKVLDGWKNDNPDHAMPSPREAERLNVEAACGEMVIHSEVLASRVQSGKLLIRGSIFDLKTGRVSFFEQGRPAPDLP